MSTIDATTAIRLGIENGRAKYAFETVSDFVNKPNQQDKIINEYCSYIKKIPAMIQVNGLGQTLAFCFAKGGQYREIYNHIAGWVSQKQPDLLMRHSENRKMEFVEIVVSMNRYDYRIISNEVIALLDWMRRFADGMNKDIKSNDKAKG